MEKISRRVYSKSLPQERAHGDGIMVDFDSPEAFEEVFWLTFCHNEYLKRSGLIPHDIDDEVCEKLRNYVAAIVHSEGEANKLYLSKNNNSILCLPSLRKAFPNSVILVAFREPLQQAESLRKQHQHFMQEAKLNSLIRPYMRWLGHYEFGAPTIGRFSLVTRSNSLIRKAWSTGWKCGMNAISTSIRSKIRLR